MTAAAAPAVASQLPDRLAVVRRVTACFGAAMVIANTAGGVIVFVFLGCLLPRSERVFIANLIGLVAYGFLSVIVGCAWSVRAFLPAREWLLGERPIEAADRRYVVRHPLRQAGINFAMWMGAEALFVAINARYGWGKDLDIAITILLGAITTCGLTYLMAERLLRPVNGIAFENALPTDHYVPGVKSRVMLAWAVGAAVPMVGVLLMAVDRSRPLSLTAVAFLSCTGLATGAIAMVFAARSIADPIESVTSALRQVEAEQFGVRVPVYDGSQIGQLQSGFNTMVEGLGERQRLHDLFGRQVGSDVARHALERGVHLGGEAVDAAVLFVDVIGSTELAATRPAQEVVSALNAFFAVVVEVMDHTGGLVNKFEGDAALCVFGTPVPREDAATCALKAGRMLQQRLRLVRGLSAAIGVSAGPVVAGNIGARARYEFTVIGDVVNEAARLTELAKTSPSRLLASSVALDRADLEERRHWQPGEPVVLRGRSTETRVAVPVEVRAAAATRGPA